MKKNEEAKLSSLKESYQVNYEAITALIDLYVYFQDVKSEKIDSTSIYGETILNNFLHVFSKPGVTISYKNIDVLQ